MSTAERYSHRLSEPHETVERNRVISEVHALSSCNTECVCREGKTSNQHVVSYDCARNGTSAVGDSELLSSGLERT